MIGAVWNTRGMTSSARVDWETPAQLYAFLDREFHFTLDVAASIDSAKCERFFTPESSALLQDWVIQSGGGACWMNPPYGRKIGEWIRKAVEEWKRGATVVILVPARTDTSWWHDYCMLGEIRFLRGRLRFDNGRRGRCPFPSAIVVLRGLAQPGAER